MCKTSKYPNYTWKTTSWHREEEPRNTNSHMTVRTQLKLGNQLSLPFFSDVCCCFVAWNNYDVNIPNTCLTHLPIAKMGFKIGDFSELRDCDCCYNKKNGASVSEPSPVK